jgi:hypothetical protein
MLLAFNYHGATLGYSVAHAGTLTPQEPTVARSNSIEM